MADEVVYQPELPSDVCLLSADGVRLRVHKQVLGAACGTFAHALDAELSGGELRVEETAQELQASGGGGQPVPAAVGSWQIHMCCSNPQVEAVECLPRTIHLQEGLLDHIYQRSSRRRRHMTEGGVRLSLELARKYNCPALMDKCEDFLCSPAFKLVATVR